MITLIDGLKKCKECGISKTLTEFHKDKKSKNGLVSTCKTCRKEYYHDNKEKMKEYGKQYRIENKEKLKEYYQDNKEHKKEQKKEYYQDNKEAINQHHKEYYRDNKEKKKEYYHDNKEHKKEQAKKHYHDNKEEINQKMKEYYHDNKDKLKEQKKEYYQNNKEQVKKDYTTRKRLLNGFKKECVICGFKDKTALVFHHRDPKEKKFNIAHKKMTNFEKLQTEIAKCTVLCSNCHKSFHYYNHNPSERPKELLKKYIQLDLNPIT